MTKFKLALAKIVDNLSEAAGNPIVFATMVLLVCLWFVAGFALDFDEVWFTLLDIFVFLTTFFLVFVVQSSQNADTKAIHDKLDEIIRAQPQADNKKRGEEKAIKQGKKSL